MDSKPLKPHYRNEPQSSWLFPDLKILWAYRELLFFLAWRDIQVRYKQTLLGVVWVVIQPLLTVLLFTTIFHHFAGIASDSIPYFLFSYAGLLLWTFFASTVSNSSQSLVGNTNLITKVYFPRLLIPGATVGAGTVDLLVSFLLLFLIMMVYGLPFTWRLIMLPFLIFLTILLSLGVGILLSALNVKYRDIRHTVPFLLQFWMFVSPVIYPTSLIPDKWRWIFLLNPLTGIIESFRAVLFSKVPIDWAALGLSTLVTTAILIVSSYVFRRMERNFADLI